MNVSRETCTYSNMDKKELIGRSAERFSLIIDDQKKEDLILFLNELVKWNTKIKLIGPGTYNEHILLHIIDSIAPLNQLPDNIDRMLDLGAGGGMPCIPVKIMKPDWSISCVDSIEKKTAFVRHAVRVLKFEKFNVYNTRFGEKDALIPKASFDLVVFRAVGSLQKMLPIANMYLSNGGIIAAYKGPGYKQELREAEDVVKNEKLELIKVSEFKLPFIERDRSVLIFKRLVDHPSMP